MKNILIKLLTPLLALGFGALALAQEAPTAPGPNTEAAAFDDGTIEKFADAYKSVMSVQQELASELEGVETNEEAQELQMGAQEKMVGAVVDSGLSIEEYNRVVMAMENNPELAQRVLNKIQ